MIWAALCFTGGALLAMVLGEMHESASYLARWITKRAAQRLGSPMDEIRQEEWLGILDRMDGLHLLRLLRALGFATGGFRIRFEHEHAQRSLAVRQDLARFVQQGVRQVDKVGKSAWLLGTRSHWLPSSVTSVVVNATNKVFNQLLVVGHGLFIASTYLSEMILRSSQAALNGIGAVLDVAGRTVIWVFNGLPSQTWRSSDWLRNRFLSN